MFALCFGALRTEKIANADTLLRDALTFLNDRRDPRWVSEAWFLQKATKFYEELTPERTAQVLQNLGYVRQVNYQVERILVRLAERQPEAVWDYFGSRLAREAADGEGEERFDAVPFRFHGGEGTLERRPTRNQQGCRGSLKTRSFSSSVGVCSATRSQLHLEFAAALAGW
jgi:hypothetical protein